MKLTVSDLIAKISRLPRDRYYHYVSKKTKGKIKIKRIVEPEGPIYIERMNEKGDIKEESLPTNMLHRIASAFQPDLPINFDRVLGGSYNTRSVLEALLVHTAEFYYTYPDTVFINDGLIPTFKKVHKHVIWKPDKPHKHAMMEEYMTNIVISESPSHDAYYESVEMPSLMGACTENDINIARRHAQIQVALVEIGKQLGFRTWVAQNDKGIIYKDRPLKDMETVVSSLKSEKLLIGREEAAENAKLIDCVWFKNGKLMPAVMEIEHSTGVTSGLTRMKNFYDEFIRLEGVRYVIVAPDDLRSKVLQEANKAQFKALNTLFFPYSAVDELYSLCKRRNIRGVTEDFLDCYMEPMIQANNTLLVS
ncbi:hypothetical protein [Sulfurimonas sp.]|uniref:hypothetical protein n=1 Tax=Sulfurimonas sp. TaxID=2022749 RepID=UPI002611F2ED|nr:hypothetical protein [Sulfurimonas sp.]MDD3855936.1 hypothetical protein [Sulfurimonas sp.]